jgi:hypothetical protein
MAVTQLDGGRQIKAGTITNAEISASANIALTKLAEAVVQADGGQAFTADQSMGGFKLTNLADPVSSSDAANKSYVDSARAGLDVKQSVRVATTAAGTLATSFENGDTVDGVTLATGDRILIKDQAAGAENGIYTVNASGTPTRATDADSNTEVTAGMFVFVEEGTTNADTGWVLTNNGAITLGTTALTFSQFSGAGSFTDGAGLTRTGNSLAVNVDGSTIEISSDALRVKDAGITYAKIQNVSAASKLLGRGDSGAGAPQEITLGSGLTMTGTTLSASASGLGTSNFVFHETPSGSVNGSNTAFTLANTPTAGTVQVFLNGILQEPGSGNDYTISGATITYLTAPATGDKIRVHYMK